MEIFVIRISPTSPPKGARKQGDIRIEKRLWEIKKQTAKKRMAHY
jgi:hypothetical protein